MLTLNRPSKRNALNQELCKNLIEALFEANNDARVGAIMLSGAGTVFCSGMDLHEALDEHSQDSQLNLHSELFSIGFKLRKPVVAAVHGAALGGGLGLALNAHFVVASADAKFGLTEVRLGLWPYLIHRVVVHAIGERRTVQLALAGRILGSKEALQWGLVDEVTPATNLQQRAADLSDYLSRFSSKAIRDGLDFVAAVRDATEAEFMLKAVRLRSHAQDSPDFIEGVRAFLEKREPKWQE